MSQQSAPANLPTAAVRSFDPGHVVTRQHYEALAREAASQK
jgi:hypothetical protein